MGGIGIQFSGGYPGQKQKGKVLEQHAGRLRYYVGGNSRAVSCLEIALWGFLVCGMSGGFAFTWYPYLLLGLISALLRRYSTSFQGAGPSLGKPAMRRGQEWIRLSDPL